MMNWPFKKSRTERDAEAAKRAQRERLETLFEIGREEDFVAMVKAANPDIKRERLLALIEMYREVRRQRAKRGAELWLQFCRRVFQNSLAFEGSSYRSVHRRTL